MTDADIRSRVDELLAQMTPAEKAGQLTQYFYFGFEPDPEAVPGTEQDDEQGSQPAAVEAAMARGEVGSLLFQTDPAEINRLQRLTIEGNRLGIPAIFGYDVIHGLRTILPVPIGLAASWDPETIERGQAVAARGAGSGHPLGLRPDGGHRPRPALGPHHRRRR
jgi:beta-glucosidase